MHLQILVQDFALHQATSTTLKPPTLKIGTCYSYTDTMPSKPPDLEAQLPAPSASTSHITYSVASHVAPSIGPATEHEASLEKDQKALNTMLQFIRDQDSAPHLPPPTPNQNLSALRRRELIICLLVIMSVIFVVELVLLGVKMVQENRAAMHKDG